MVRTVSYDRTNDILVAHKGFFQGKKFKGYIEIGDLVFDLSTKLRIRGIKIMNARQYLKEFLKLSNSKTVHVKIK